MSQPARMEEYEFHSLNWGHITAYETCPDNSDYHCGKVPSLYQVCADSIVQKVENGVFTRTVLPNSTRVNMMEFFFNIKIERGLLKYFAMAFFILMAPASSFAFEPHQHRPMFKPVSNSTSSLVCSVPILDNSNCFPSICPPARQFIVTNPQPVDPPVPIVVLRVRVVACASPDDPISYRLTLENNSPAAAHHVRVKNPIPANAKYVSATPRPKLEGEMLVWEFGTLSGHCCKEITLLLQPTSEGEIKNCARVSFEHGQCVVTRVSRKLGPGMGIGPGVPGGGKVNPGDGKPGIEKPDPIKPGTKTPPDVKNPPGAARGNLSLSITGPKKAYAKTPVTYSIKVKNNGKSVALDVLIKNQLPPNTSFRDASEPGKFLADQVAWVIGNLQPDEEKAVTVTIESQAAGEICNKIEAVFDSDSRVIDETCTTFRGVPALNTMLKNADGPLPVGKKTSYVLEVTNNGTASFTNLKITAIASRELRVYEANGESDPPEKPKDLKEQGQMFQFQPLKELLPGKTVSYTIFVEGTKAGDGRLVMRIQADQLSEELINSQSTTVYDPDEKTKEPPLPGKPPGLGPPNMSSRRSDGARTLLFNRSALREIHEVLSS